MKIYNKLVIDIISNEILYEDSYNYLGEVAECKGGTSVSAPGPSPQEIKMQSRQLEILESQWAQQQEFAPFVLESMGLRRNTETGQLEKFEDPLTEEEQLVADITKETGERALSALRGELPVSSTVHQIYEEGEKGLKEELSSRLGPQYALTTGGGSRLEEFRKGKASAFDAAMRGEITAGTASYLQTLGALPGLRQQQYSLLTGAQAPGLQLAQAYGQAQSPYQFTRGLTQQAAMQGAQLKNQRILAQYQLAGSALGAGGQAGGAYYGAQAAAASSRSFKQDISNLSNLELEEVLSQLLNIDVVNYTYKPETRNDAKKHIGVIAEDIPQQLVTSDGKHIDLVDFVAYLLVGVQQTAKRVEKLEQEKGVV